jgi:hypothetical protein
MLKTVSTLSNILGSLVYQGTWNASTNTPALASSVGQKGDYYYVSVAGTTNLNGITDWQVGDFAVFNGAIWQKVDNTDVVQSVNGQVGIVVLGANDVGAAANTVNIIAGTGLIGGGALTGNVTLIASGVPVGNITGLGTMATQNSNAVTITGGNINAQATNLTGNTSISATMSNASLLLVPAGYLFANVNSTVVKIPYYTV